MKESDNIDPVYKYVEAYVDRKVKNLKGRITKLENRVESTELLGLQEQINSITSQIENLGLLTLDLVQRVADLNIRHNLLWALWALIPMQQTNKNAPDCIRYIRERAAAALVEVSISNTPLEVADNWYSMCRDYLVKHGNIHLFDES